VHTKISKRTPESAKRSRICKRDLEYWLHSKIYKKETYNPPKRRNLQKWPRIRKRDLSYTRAQQQEPYIFPQKSPKNIHILLEMLLTTEFDSKNRRFLCFRPKSVYFRTKSPTLSQNVPWSGPWLRQQKVNKNQSPQKEIPIFAQKLATFSHEEPYISAKEPQISTKEPYTKRAQKEIPTFPQNKPYRSAKEPWSRSLLSQKEISIFPQKEPYTSAKEPCRSAKEP